MITADDLATRLITSFPAEFAPVTQFGHTIPVYNLNGQLVDLEVFNHHS